MVFLLFVIIIIVFGRVFSESTVAITNCRRWLLSVGAYSFCQQENERLTVNMRLTVYMRLIGMPLITMGGVIIINASGGVQYFTIKPTAK